MPLPRYQPVKKKAKLAGPSLADLDDKCISRIICHALALSRERDNQPYKGDNTRTERNLSLVCKKWFFITQIHISRHGVIEINLDEVAKSDRGQATNLRHFAVGMNTPMKRNLLTSSTGSKYNNYQMSASKTPHAGRLMRPGVLMQRNATASVLEATRPSTKTSYDIQFFKSIYPKLLKYKHVQIKGSITGDNLIKLILALDSARVERVDILDLKIEGKVPQSYFIPQQLPHLEVFSVIFATDSKSDHTNELIWKLFDRACELKEFHVYLKENLVTNEAPRVKDLATRSFIEMLNILAKTSTKKQSHPKLDKLVFNRPTLSGEQLSSTGCDYSEAIKYILSSERSIGQVETNDNSLVEHLIKTSNRLCTMHDVRSLTLTAPIRSLETLAHIIKLQNLGTDFLSIIIDDIDLLGEVVEAIETFKLKRHKFAQLKMNLYLKDQKVPDCDDKVKSLTHISRLADMTVYVSALQRISIDCCHLMWSTGRGLANISGKCIFKISLQTYPIKPNVPNPCEITVPLGKCPNYYVNSAREDIVRHREIMKSLKRDCYHQFVKSVRENIS